MPDTNTYTTLTPIRKVVSKTEFDAMDKTNIPIGTEYDIVGEIEKTDLSPQLQSEIDGKIDKPATDGTSGQVLTLGTDGKAKWADSASGGGAKYRHCLHIANSNPLRVIEVYVDTASNNQITALNVLYATIVGSISITSEFYYPCCGSWAENGTEANTVTVTGCKFLSNGGNVTLKLFLSNNTSTTLGNTDVTISDAVITL